jgi:hypothetical protein
MDRITWTALLASPGAAIARAPLEVTYGRGEVAEVYRLDPQAERSDMQVSATTLIRHSGRVVTALRQGQRVRVSWLADAAAVLSKP